MIDLLRMMQQEIIATARSIMEQNGFGDAELQRFQTVFRQIVASEEAKYGDRGQEALQSAQRIPQTPLGMYILMHRLRRETVLLIGTALVNAGYLEMAGAIEQTLNEFLGE